MDGCIVEIPLLKFEQHHQTGAAFIPIHWGKREVNIVISQYRDFAIYRIVELAFWRIGELSNWHFVARAAAPKEILELANWYISNH